MLERRAEPARIGIAIFDRIAGLDDLGALEPLDRCGPMPLASAGSEVEMPLG